MAKYWTLTFFGNFIYSGMTAISQWLFFSCALVHAHNTCSWVAGEKLKQTVVVSSMPGIEP